MGFCSVLGHIPLGFIGFNKPPIEDQLPVDTNRIHYSLKTIQAPL